MSVEPTVGRPAVGDVSRRRRTWLLAVVPGLLWMLVLVGRSGVNPYGGWRITLFDDAMISMTYGRTLADTGEWVWFPGAERVQGITNPAWTLVMAALHAAGLDDSGAALGMAIIGAASVLAVSWLVFVIVAGELDGRTSGLALAAVAGGAVPFLYPFVFWSLRGMEVGVVAALVALLIWSLGAEGARPHRTVAIVASTAVVVTRLDASLLVLAVLAVDQVGQVGRAGAHADPAGRHRRDVAMTAAAATILTMVAISLFQWRYWGDWLPNTYHLKMSGYGTRERLARGVVSLGKTLPVLVVTGVAVYVVERSGDRAIARRCRQLAAVVAAGVVYATWVGGDAWESYLTTSRYVSTVLPFAVAVTALAVGVTVSGERERLRRAIVVGAVLVLVAALGAGLVSNPYRFHVGYAVMMLVVMVLAVASAARIWNRSAPLRSVALVTVIVACVGAYPAARWIRFGGLHVADDHYEAELGTRLRAVTDEDAVIAVSLAGASAYYAQRPMVDLLGKSDPVIARIEPRGPLYPGHNKFDYDYSVGRLRPDVVVRSVAVGSDLGRRLTEWGYVRRCVVLSDGDHVANWFLIESTRIHWGAVRDCPNGP